MRRLVLSFICLLSITTANAGKVITLPDSVAEGYIAFGERYLHKPWAELPDSVFAQFKKNGNRVNYEAIVFERRRQLAALVMAEVVEDKGRFMNDILNGIDVHLDEPWWGIPAHYSKPKPDRNIQTVDLFNAESASLVAWTRHLLADKLDAMRHGICDSIDNDITRRILVPAVSENYWWKRASMNWNPWICSNWLACISFCEHDAARRSEALRQIGDALKFFVDSYPDDGGCDEGPGYWDRAAASLFECLQWHDFEGLDHAKIKKMGAYIYKLYIGNDYCVDFADSHTNKSVQQINILYPFALYANDKTMRQFAGHMFCRNLAKYYENSGNFPTLGREIVFLRHFDELAREEAREPLMKHVWLDKLQIMTTRQHEGSTAGLFLAMKGGNNDESHNHNDVGSFLVYADGQPLLIDVGVGEYTSQTFSGDRYSIWTMQSAYHNLPIINGVCQKNGRQYKAKNVEYSPGRLTMDIAEAYPADAKVQCWKRTVSLNDARIDVTEDYCLEEYIAPTQINFITIVPPVVKKNKVALGDRVIKFSSRQMSASVEDISENMDTLLRNMWGDKLYRITLTLRSTSPTGKVAYTIK